MTTYEEDGSWAESKFAVKMEVGIAFPSKDAATVGELSKKYHCSAAVGSNMSPLFYLQSRVTIILVLILNTLDGGQFFAFSVFFLPGVPSALTTLWAPRACCIAPASEACLSIA